MNESPSLYYITTTLLDAVFAQNLGNLRLIGLHHIVEALIGDVGKVGNTLIVIAISEGLI